MNEPDDVTVHEGPFSYHSSDGGRTWDDRTAQVEYGSDLTVTLDLHDLPSAVRVAMALGIAAIAMPLAAVFVGVELVRRLRR